jgi:hypothetical protein
VSPAERAAEKHRFAHLVPPAKQAQVRNNGHFGTTNEVAEKLLFRFCSGRAGLQASV